MVNRTRKIFAFYFVLQEAYKYYNDFSKAIETQEKTFFHEVFKVNDDFDFMIDLIIERKVKIRENIKRLSSWPKGVLNKK